MTDFISIESLTPYCVGFTQEQLKQAKNICDTFQLTPVKRQIHFSLRNKKNGNSWVQDLSFMVTVDGLRGIAERGGSYEGQAGPFWCGKDGKWVDIWVQDTPPVAAKVGVFKKNFREALYAVAKFEEYKQTDKEGKVTGMWNKMSATMIAKCAEALALRRAFPDETGGLYTTEEMEQSSNPVAISSKQSGNVIDVSFEVADEVKNLAHEWLSSVKAHLKKIETFDDFDNYVMGNMKEIEGGVFSSKVHSLSDDQIKWLNDQLESVRTRLYKAVAKTIDTQNYEPSVMAAG